jgi:hypothetical protein
MLEFIACCKDVVKYFHNHHVAKAHLRDLQFCAVLECSYKSL